LLRIVHFRHAFGGEAPLRRDLHTCRSSRVVFFNDENVKSVPAMLYSRHFVQGSTSKS
jgi:hypothetical protein